MIYSSPAETSPEDIDSMPSPTGAKTLILLDLLSRHSEGLTAAEAARESGFTQNLVFRILKTLVALGYAMQREDRKAYVLTNRLLELSGPRSGEKSLVFCANEALRRLRDETGETVQLAIESGGKLLVLEQFRGTYPLQVSGEVGMRVPLYSCAPGKAILASWGEVKREEWFSGKGRKLKSYTKTTLSTRERLEEEIRRIRELGYAEDRAEGIEGIHCVAVPIHDTYGQPLGAITVMAPLTRMPEADFATYAERCYEAKSSIEIKLRA
ncbi:MAG: IclR family transcriptional regulator [Verrucomicrobiales bacterium]|nr:IclR family transcriptional regulator [Verrucomicrobiales bacterium]